ncbi:MAG: choice-of-anchor D domain-containing protein [Niastella sp.]|nr:choice-of-anchor D domain-containing protein [Niastella sp.]
MKKAFTVFAISIFYIFVHAQQPYPTAPSSPGNITAIEYFIDANVSQGSGTPVTGFTASQNINGFSGTVDLTGIPFGFHRIYIRTKDINGNWSLSNNRFFDNYNLPIYSAAPPAATNIIQLEYFLDNNDLGFGNCTQIPITAATDIANLNANINITGLYHGVHRVFIRAKDAGGKWSLVNYEIFDNSQANDYPVAPLPASNIVQLEYFLDNNDLGFGNCTQIPITAATDIANLNANINITGLTPGVHRVFIRAKDAGGKWSLVNYEIFDNSQANDYPVAPLPASNIVQLEYFLDNNDLGFGNCTQIPITAATDIANLNANINITGLTPGVHRVFIRAKDAGGKWSLVNYEIFDNSQANDYPVAPLPASNIVQLEYFLDNNDLGFGNCTQIPITAATDIANLNANINITGLTPGVHRVFIRAKDAGGKWSLVNYEIFDNSSTYPYPTAPPPVTNIVQLEYFIDSDPGFGNGNAIAITPAVDISNLLATINFTALSSGNHILYIRSKDNSNKWSVTNIKQFIAGLIAVSPDSLLYGNTIVGNNATANISIKNNSTTTQSINNINIASPFSISVSTPITINAGDTYNLPVTFTPTATQFYRDSILLETSAGNFKAILKGQGIAVNGSWAISPAAGYDYQNVILNNTANFNFSISNTGNIPIILNDVIISDPAFVPTYTIGTTIPVGGNIVLPVAFTPTAVLTYTAQIKIKSSTAAIDSVTTIVTGKGYTPGTVPVLQFVSTSPFNGSTGVNPAVAQTGFFTYKILYASANNLPPKTGYPKIGIDLNADHDFNDLGEGIFSMTQEGSGTDFVNGEIYSYTFNHTSNSNSLGYQFFADDVNGNTATTINNNYISGPIVTDQVLDLKIFANNISFNINNPSPGQSFNLSAVVTNSTSVPAINVPVKFYRDTILLDSVIIPVVNPNSTASITQPFNFATEGFYPIKVYINPDQAIPESNYLNNYAIRPIIVGSPNLPGGITVTSSLSIQNCPQLKAIISGHANYFGTALPTSVAGATVTINTAAGPINTTTDVNGNYSYQFTGITCGGNFDYTVSVTDFTFTSSLLTQSVAVSCPGTNACTQPPSQGGLQATYNTNPCANQVGQNATINLKLKYRERDLSNMWCGWDEIIKDTLKIFVDGVLYQTYASADYSHSPGEEINLQYYLPLSSTSAVSVTAILSYTYIEYLQIPTSIYHGQYIAMVQTGGTTIQPVSNKPDLTIQQFRQTGFTSFDFLDANINCKSSGAHVVKTYDSIPGGSYSLIKTSNVTGIAGKSATSISYNDIHMAPGDHFIKIITDANADIVEEVETNNEFIFKITVPLPDLTVTKVLTTPTTASIGTAVTFKATIKNSGKYVDAFKVSFLVNGVQLGTKKSVISLAGNESIVISSDTYLVTDAENTCGPTIEVIADSDGDITESNESNNNLQIQFTADIRPYQLSFEQGSASNPVVVRVNTINQFFPPVRNTGMRDVSNVSVSFVLNGNVIGSGNITTIKAGEPYAAYTSFTQMFTAAGDYVVTVIADTANMICETDETNNTGDFHIRVVDSKMDFEVLSQYISPSSLNPNIGQSITLVGTVRNSGGKISTPNVLRFLVDDIQLGADVPINPILPGRDTTVAATVPYSSLIPGVKVMKIIADPDNLAIEERENNNTATRALIVGDAPDMAKDAGNAISFNPSGFRTGDSVLISYKIKNNGPTEGTAWVKFLILDETDAITAIDSVEFTLAAGANTIISKRMKFDIEKGTVLAQIINCTPIEFDLTNNDDALPFSTVSSLKTSLIVSGDLDMDAGLPDQLPGWIGGKIILGDYDLIINGIIKNFDTAHFIITNGTGKLKLNNANAMNEFPVGTRLYSTNFVKINNTGTTDNFSVRLLPYVLMHGNTGDTVLTDNVNCTWLIEEQIPGGSDATIEMFWNPADELTGFDRLSCRTAHYTISWQLGTTGSAATNSIGLFSKSQDGYDSFSPFTVTSGSGVIPLQLLQFKAERQGANAILSWQTTNEVNTAGFTIQHSIDGITFTNIGSVAAANTSGINIYHFTHIGIHEKLNYYRLKMIDNNGRFTYSDIQLVKIDLSVPMQIFPNPATQFINITGLNANGIIEILTLEGKIINRIKTTTGPMNINIRNLAAGVYIIRYQNNNEVQIQKIIKQ